MRMSCNGCRVLRKGCSENCSIRPCLQWIKNPESQANATVFLAKFYGRAGLMNLINAGPEHLRPDVFRSLLYEACGRIVNPIYGSVGLLWSGCWQLCQSAVESVLRGSPIVSISSEIAESTLPPPIKGYDIRHAGKEGGGFTAELHKIGKCRKRFKRSGANTKTRAGAPAILPEPASPESWSHESAGSRPENESMFSVETVEAASHVSQGEPNQSWVGEMGLELTLGFEPMSRHGDDDSYPEGRWCEKISPAVEDDCGINLQLDLAVITLDTGLLVAGTKYHGEFEERLKKLMEEIKQSDEIILFIDEVHTLIGAGGAEGAIDAANILKPALVRGELQLQRMPPMT